MVGVAPGSGAAGAGSWPGDEITTANAGGAVVLDHGVGRPDAGGGGGPGGALTQAGLTTPEGVCGVPAEVLNRAIGKERAAQLIGARHWGLPGQNQVSLL